MLILPQEGNPADCSPTLPRETGVGGNPVRPRRAPGFDRLPEKENVMPNINLTYAEIKILLDVVYATLAKEPIIREVEKTLRSAKLKLEFAGVRTAQNENEADYLWQRMMGEDGFLG